MNWEQVFATRTARMKASEIRELLKLLERPDIISFAGGIPDPELFPRQAFAEAYAQILATDDGKVALQYSVSEGYKPLKTWLVGEMAKIGIPCTEANILMTSGSQQVLDYLGKLFLSPGDTALVASPTYLGALSAFNAYEPAYDQLNHAGNRTPQSYHETAENNGSQPKFAYVVADFANPTGETMTLEQRNALLDMATSLDIPVIEDAAYQALRYDGEQIDPILALDIARCGSINATRTLYCGSFSKTLAPGLRVGWVVASEDVISKLVLMKQAADLHTSTINQMVIDHVVRTGFDEQVAKIRSVYRLRRDRMLAALEQHMPDGVHWTKPEGGMFIWVTLPSGYDSAALLAKSLNSVKVAFVPGKAFHSDASGANTLRLSYSCASNAQIDEGIKRLGQLLSA